VFHQRKLLTLSIIGLVILGAAGIILRWVSTRSAPVELRESHWRISYAIIFRSKDAPVQGSVFLPAEGPSIRITRETFSHSQMGIFFQRDEENLEREILLLAPQHPGLSRFEAQFEVLVNEDSKGFPVLSESLSDEVIADYVKAEEEIQSDTPTVLQTVQKIGAQDADPGKLLSRIFSYCVGIPRIHAGNVDGAFPKTPSDALSVIEKNAGTPLGKARAMVALLRAGRIPGRLVSGFLFSNQGAGNPHIWVEAYLNGQWQPYDPTFNRYGQLGPHYLPLRRHGTGLFECAGVQDLRVAYSVKRKAAPSTVPATNEKWLRTVLDLTNLQPRLSDAVTLILLLPLGGLVISIFSNIFNLKSFGYFIPALIALSFVDVAWTTGITIFIVITGIGLGSRAFLNRLNLNKMPRLTLVLLSVVFSLTITVALLDFLGIKPSPRAVLLPMISLTMMIENFHARSEDQGYGAAFKKLGITLSVAFCCLLLFNVDRIQWLLLTFPESEFFIAATLILVGRYKPGQDKATAASTTQPTRALSQEDKPANDE
jgi:hypothetical protein